MPECLRSLIFQFTRRAAPSCNGRAEAERVSLPLPTLRWIAAKPIRTPEDAGDQSLITAGEKIRAAPAKGAFSKPMVRRTATNRTAKSPDATIAKGSWLPKPVVTKSTEVR